MKVERESDVMLRLTLKLDKLLLEDSGEIKVVATNSEGVAECVAKLIVKGLVCIPFF